MIWAIFFWLGFGLTAYHIIIYPVLMWLLSKLAARPVITKSGELSLFPTVSVICPAYNEEAHIDAKIRSFLALDYPKDKIHLYIISDSSTDNTNEIVKCYLDYNVSLIIQSPRGGKQRAHNLIEPALCTDYVLSTDANSIFQPDSVMQLVRALEANPDAGIASGELNLVKKGSRDSGEGLYWKYECFLKKMDSAFASIIGSNGSLYLIRRNLFTQISPDTIDDFERTLYVLSKGYRALYVPEALVTEEVTEKAQQEINRKVRIITREWIALRRYACLLNPFRYGRITLILISHKLIRWLFFLFLLMMLVSSAMLKGHLFQWIFLLQVFFYWIGVMELNAQKTGKHIPGTGMIAYVTAMGWSSLLAFTRFVLNKNSGVWNPVRTKG